MRRKTVGLYTPYLDVMGGGEKHILSILKVFDEAGYNVIIFWDNDLTQVIKEKLHLTFKHLTFAKSIRRMSLFEKARILSPLEWLLYVTDGSYFFSPAKHTGIFCMVPDKKLYQMTPLNALKTVNSMFFANSFFTKNWLHKWGIDSQVLYPFVPKELFTQPNTVKKPYVLTVGRFFRHLHSKRQDDLIRTFLHFHHQHPEFKLILAGGVMPEDEGYVDELRKAFPQPFIELKTNIPFAELKKLYGESLIYWHFAGFGVDESKHPEQVEHLGMTPLEAMASRCITFCYNAGGPKELIRESKNGFVFNTKDELIRKMNSLLNRPTLQTQIQDDAQQFVKDSFSYEPFKKHVVNIFNLHS